VPRRRIEKAKQAMGGKGRKEEAHYFRGGKEEGERREGLFFFLLPFSLSLESG